MFNSDKIGYNAGIVWHLLDENGEMPIEHIAKKTGLSVEDVYAALGWLAREDKIVYKEHEGNIYIYLPKCEYYY